MYREPGSILYLLAALPALHVAVTQGSYIPTYLTRGLFGGRSFRTRHFWIVLVVVHMIVE